MALDVAVCIPWRPQPHRIAAFNYVTSWWTSQGLRVVLGDSDHEVFNISAARNRAVTKAHADIVIVADADTVPSMAPMTTALRQVQKHMVIYPFSTYRYISAEPSPDLDLEKLPAEREYRNSVGGLFVCHSETYWELGGMDAGFERWGYEDNAFHLAAETLARVVRIPGAVYAFGHEAERDMSRQNPGASRIELYRFARRKPDIMRELVKR